MVLLEEGVKSIRMIADPTRAEMEGCVEIMLIPTSAHVEKDIKGTTVELTLMNVNPVLVEMVEPVMI